LLGEDEQHSEGQERQKVEFAVTAMFLAVTAVSSYKTKRKAFYRSKRKLFPFRSFDVIVRLRTFDPTGVASDFGPYFVKTIFLVSVYDPASSR
jgi:hypothetical protein